MSVFGTPGSIVWSVSDGHDSSLCQFNIETGESKHVEAEKIKNSKHAFWVREWNTTKERNQQMTKILNYLVKDCGWDYPDRFIMRATTGGHGNPLPNSSAAFKPFTHWLDNRQKFGVIWDQKIKKIEYFTAHEIPHHAQHALAAYHCSPYNNAFIITTDGLGDGSYYSEMKVQDGKVSSFWQPLRHTRPSEKTNYDIKLSSFAGWVKNVPDEYEDAYCGVAQIFRALGHVCRTHISPHVDQGRYFDTLDYAGKVMGLSAQLIDPPRALVNYYKKIIKSAFLFEQWADGTLESDNYMLSPINCYNIKDQGWVNQEIRDKKRLIFNTTNPPFRPYLLTEEEEIVQCSSVQRAGCEAFLEHIRNPRIAKQIRECDGNLIIAGGGALNVVINQFIKENTDYNIFIPPDPGDSGLSFGLATWYAQKEGWKGYDPDKRPHRRFLDLPFDTTDMENYKNKIPVDIETIAHLLEQGKIIGLIQGNIENGPRALGNRSILCNPEIPDMRDRINSKIKNREWYRPFAPVCRLEDSNKFFDSRSFDNLEHMSFVVDVKPEFKNTFPSITHVDGTARLQTVTKEGNSLLYDILSVNKKVLLNTSFNVQGKPILNDWKTAEKILITTDLHHIVYKDEKGNLWLYS